MKITFLNLQFSFVVATKWWIYAFQATKRLLGYVKYLVSKLRVLAVRSYGICFRFTVGNRDSALTTNLICILTLHRSTWSMGEGDSYGCKTYFLISIEGILYLLQFVSESRTTFKLFLCVPIGYFRLFIAFYWLRFAPYSWNLLGN